MKLEIWNKNFTESCNVRITMENFATKTQNHEVTQNRNLVIFSALAISWQLVFFHSLLNTQI